jgi:protein O-GlcNAc transferase
MLRRWIRKLLPGMRDAAAANENGIALWQLGDLSAAEALFREALVRDSGHAPSCSNLGMVLFGQGKLQEALVNLRQAVEFDPAHIGARANLGGVLHRMQWIEESLEHFREALRLSGDNPHLLASSLRPLDACAWDEVLLRLEKLQRDALEDRENWADQIMPFASQLLPLSEALQLRIARWHAAKIENHTGMLPRTDVSKLPGARIRIGYVSTDFHDHATAYLATAMLEAHDRGRFEIFAYSAGLQDAGRYRKRISLACAHFVDISAMTGAASAALIAADGIDILVDMNGHTAGGRLDIFALRPAPIQVAFLGYPGTTGAAFIDYLIADQYIAPPGCEAGFSEHLVRMPHSYQPNERPAYPAALKVTRVETGLPEDAFVFCCFNQHFKLEPQIFRLWMRILSAIPESVLWLIAGNRLSESRLIEQAQLAGVDPARLIFAPFVERERHLARHRLADLCLDTHTVNGHTTGSDALLAGVPMVSWPASSFAGRVGASLLHAAGMPELLVTSAENYVELAMGLARTPSRLLDLRDKLAAAHGNAPLFDASRFAFDLERAFLKMSKLRNEGHAARGFAVQELS